MDQHRATSRLPQLAATISDAAAKLQAILSEQGTPSPSFDENVAIGLPREVLEFKDVLLDATAELHDLLLEPMDLLLHHGAHANSVCLQAISRFHITAIVPVGGQISFADIAAKSGMTTSMVRRILRHAMTMRIFREPELEIVAHTRASRWLVKPHVNAWLSNGTEDMWPAMVKVVEAAQKWPNSQEANETAFSLVNNTTDSIYGVLAENPDRASRFSAALKTFAESSSYDVAFISDHYDWASLGPVKVVDMGGSRGHISMELARKFANLEILVQDMDIVIQGAEEDVPKDLKSRVRFMAHDFFAPQPVEADVYYCRWIFHNWPDKDAIIMLRGLIPALRSQARLLIHEACMPEAGEIPLWRERGLRAFDITMAALFNARERTVSEWKSLLAEADPRFELHQIIDPQGSALAILDIRWNAADS